MTSNNDLKRKLRKHDKRFDKLEKKVTNIYKPLAALVAVIITQLVSYYLHIGK